LRLVGWSAFGVSIGHDRTPPGVTRRQNPTKGGAWFAGAGGAVLFSGGMAVSVEMQHTGCVPVVRAEIAAIIEHALADRPGDWRVSIIGSQANDRWEMKITGPNAFERSYTLEGSAGEHEPPVIGTLVARIVPGRGL